MKVKRSLLQKEPCSIIAEAGSIHNGSLDQAQKSFDVEADAKADALKV